MQFVADGVVGELVIGEFGGVLFEEVIVIDGGLSVCEEIVFRIKLWHGPETSLTLKDVSWPWTTLYKEGGVRIACLLLSSLWVIHLSVVACRLLFPLWEVLRHLHTGFGMDVLLVDVRLRHQLYHYEVEDHLR